ncbi:60S ribosomal protein L23a-like [Octopus sinensis]|uniref:60S ribosomal protein L23a-like n=1 Tax=Octopus sinensis TaxID=2607531 RepID=A0A6P7U9H0_9MOLL|nr:60S ribosomal protein L23a-like [Octopus sinensis]
MQVEKKLKLPTKTTVKQKIRTKIRFYRPKTQKSLPNPKYASRIIPRKNQLVQSGIIKYPLSTETAMKKIENENTLVFIVDIHANKPQIRRAVNSEYNVKTARVNTLIRPDGKKKAYVRLTSDYDALDVANKLIRLAFLKITQRVFWHVLIKYWVHVEYLEKSYFTS